MKKYLLLLSIIAGFSMWFNTPAGFSDYEGSHMMTEGSHRQSEAVTVLIQPIQKDSNISGKAVFEETEEGLKIDIEISGASPGKHGIHIHEHGSCADGGNAAGGHFNPDGVEHGDLELDGFPHAHAGDLGNIEIGPDGNGKLEKVVPGLTLDKGKYGVLGRSIILHEKEDDFGQPTGNAGGRIACGVIQKD